MSIEELKDIQKRVIKKNKIINIVGFFILILIMMFTIWFIIRKEMMFPFSIVFLVIEINLYIIISLVIKARVNSADEQLFYKEFKNIFVHKALLNYFSDLKYNEDDGFKEDYINQLGMLDTGDKFHSNDYISGKYKNIKFEQSDIHIEEKHEETDSDGNKEVVWKTTFRGRFMIFDFNKKFKSNIQVVRHGFEAHTFPYGKQLSKVEMEDEEFNKIFGIYSENEHDAFYILTPHFMEKIKKIYMKLNCSMMFNFVDNKLYIAVNNHEDSFEYNIFKKINEEEIEKDIIKDITLITDFVSDLNLDNDLFRKD